VVKPAPPVVPVLQPETPPATQSGDPPISTEPPVSPPEAASATPRKAIPGPFESGFNLVKDTVSAVGNISGVFNKYFSGPDTAETVNLIRDAVKTWHDTPTVRTSEKYLENLRQANVLRESGISKVAGSLGKKLDVIEAAVKAKEICDKRGYTGWDAACTLYAKVGQKAVVWGLTKNPVVALADAAVGGATQIAFGVDRKIDIGSVVDKSAEVWDSVTQHAANRYYRGIEKSADLDRSNNIKYLTQRIRQQVVDGKISQQEGARRLQNVINKSNRESPLL
jgi:hypothetical protein